MKKFLHSRSPSGTLHSKKFEKNIDFSLWGKQCIVLPNYNFFRVLAPTYEDPVPSLIESSESDTKSTDSNGDDDEDDIVVVKEEKVKVESSSIKKICSKKNCTKIASIDIIGANKGEKVCVDCFVDAKSANVSSKGYIANASDESDANSIEQMVSHNTIKKSVIF